MAEFGAHITGISDIGTPSIFEVLAQENLISTLRPALKYFFKVLAQNNPAKLGWLYSLGDEVYTFLELVLENYYLKNYCSSFAENFYGMKRVCVSNEGTVKSTLEKLPLSNRNCSLLFLVFIPYFKNKCDQLYDEYLDQQDRGVNYSNLWKSKLVKAFLGVYPYLHSSWEGLRFIFQMAFLFGKSKYHSPFLKWAGVMLQNLTEEDIERQQHWKGKPLDFRNKSFIQNTWSVANKGLSLLAVVVSSSLSLGVFFLQFLEWWYSSDQRTTSLTALPIPQPPEVVRKENVSKLDNICPLCNKIRTNDTALAISGYVFCYPCIYKYIKQSHQCPITGYPAETQHLVKLYLPDG